MKVHISREPKLSKIDHLFVLLAEETEDRAFDLPADLGKKLMPVIAESGFMGRGDESVTILSDGPRKISLVGLGKSDKLTQRGIRAAILNVGKTTRRHRDRSIGVVFPYQLAGLTPEKQTRWLADLLSHSDYKYDTYQTTNRDERPPAATATLIAPSSLDKKAAGRIEAEADVLSQAVRIVRDLGNGPGNVVTPARLAERAQEVAAEAGVKCTVFDKRQIEKMKMGGLLAVNRGSAEEPRFVVLEYSPKKAGKTVCLVGKGITFDSGGISIKPAERMEEMKFDMCGAAAVIGAVYAAARLGVSHRVIGIIASTENLPSGTAYKPGDIITTMSGKTVEVVNTDAEGRMILADALAYASKFDPDHVIDYATLTGACVVALGTEAAGLFSTDAELAQKLIEAGDRVGERLWRLPEWDDYKELIRSEWADMKNSGGRYAGAITAAIFLKEFVECPSWAHVDIAGTAWAENETGRDAKGATGTGVRMTVDFLESLG